MGDAQTSYPPVDCSNGTAREQLAREGSCNASSLERSGSIDAEVDNTTVPAPITQTHLSGLADKVRHLEVDYSSVECMGLADWAAFEAGITKGLEAAAKAIEAAHELADTALATEGKIDE